MKLHSGLLLGGLLLFAAGMFVEDEEVIVASLAAGGASAAAYVVALRRRVAALESGTTLSPRLPPTEARLSSLEAELDRALSEIQSLRAAQDFDRELLSARTDSRS